MKLKHVNANERLYSYILQIQQKDEECMKWTSFQFFFPIFTLFFRMMIRLEMTGNDSNVLSERESFQTEPKAIGRSKKLYVCQSFLASLTPFPFCPFLLSIGFANLFFATFLHVFHFRGWKWQVMIHSKPLFMYFDPFKRMSGWTFWVNFG